MNMRIQLRCIARINVCIFEIGYFLKQVILGFWFLQSQYNSVKKGFYHWKEKSLSLLWEPQTEKRVSLIAVKNEAFSFSFPQLGEYHDKKGETGHLTTLPFIFFLLYWTIGIGKGQAPYNIKHILFGYSVTNVSLLDTEGQFGHQLFSQKRFRQRESSQILFAFKHPMSPLSLAFRPFWWGSFAFLLKPKHSWPSHYWTQPIFGFSSQLSWLR